MPQFSGVWFPAIQAGTGADMFTVRLADALNRRGIRAEITWLPLRAEYAPWTVRVPKPPDWANIVHINSWLHTRFVPAKLPLVVTLHSCVHDPALTPYKSWLQRGYHHYWVRSLEAATLQRANAVTAVSRYTAERAAAVFGRHDITPIYNWIDTQAFSRDERQTPHSPFRLLFVGKLRRRKGADLLPEIMRRLGDGFELRYTGDARAFGVLTQLPANMVSLGRLNGTAALVAAYQECDALLFPTRLEGFGLVAAEAMACGLPVIAANNTALPEVVIDGETGFLCPTDDVDAFVHVIEMLRDDPNQWQTMRACAVRHAQAHLTEERQVAQYLELYLSLLGV